MHGSRRWFVHFQITEPGEHFGERILRFYNAPRGPYVPQSHNLALDYMSLIGRRPSARLKPADFLKGCEVLALVVTVKRNAKCKGDLPQACHYSKIDRLIRITAGRPPCTLGSRA